MTEAKECELRTACLDRVSHYAAVLRCASQTQDRQRDLSGVTQ